VSQDLVKSSGALPGVMSTKLLQVFYVVDTSLEARKGKEEYPISAGD
jgi:hypothetical protein